MIYVFYSKLNKAEVTLLELLLRASRYPLFALVDLNQAELPTAAQASKTFNFVVHEETKNVGTIEKKFRGLYGDIPYTRLDRPNGFGDNRDKLMEIVDGFFALYKGEKHRYLNSEVFSEKARLMLNEIYQHYSVAKIVNICDGNATLEIRPEHTEPTKGVTSITYSEFFLLYASRQVFKFDKIKISEIV
jgi:hypothetical protein